MYGRYGLCALLFAALLAALPGPAARAQGSGLFIDIQPQAGPPATTVTISGRGAPPGELVWVRFTPFTAATPCRAPRGPDLVAQVRASTDGTFLATHLARQINPEHAGNIYQADLGSIPGQPAPVSDVECFRFQADQGGEGRFFPETGHTVSGRFLDFWQRNGGLYIFGYPLTESLEESGRQVQYFERARFELWPENPAPYDVLLGRLGVELLEQRGIDWTTQPISAGPVAGCLYFAVTRHNVCNQQRGLGFLNTWRSNGLNLDGRAGISYQESLALFGYPITEPYQYTFPDGRTLQVQWFERARLEWHPDNPAQYRVLLGRLGAEVLEGR